MGHVKEYSKIQLESAKNKQYASLSSKQLFKFLEKSSWTSYSNKNRGSVIKKEKSKNLLIKTCFINPDETLKFLHNL